MLLSDRQLADMGLTPDTINQRLVAPRRLADAQRPAPIGLRARPAQRLAAWQRERQIYIELAAYGDRELLALGIGRGGIASIANGKLVLIFRPEGLMGRRSERGD